MIRKLLRRVFSKPLPDSSSSSPLVIPVATHGVRREQISPCAAKVVAALQERGFQAFVVGGAVRDLLLGKHPKDFDVATDARPEQVRAVVKRSRVIGRRFRLVHAYCGDEIVEVSTFRGEHGVAETDEARADEHGRILRDNVFGTQEQDAKRRDFTVNALFYDPQSQEIWDCTGGYRDLQARRLCMIGDPATRYREDPVRMLRAVRLAASLGLAIEPRSRAPISELAPLLHHVPPSRLFEEMLKLLLSGQSQECLRQLREEGLHHGLFPMLDVILEQPMGERFVNLALANTDRRIKEDKRVSPAFLLAALLWHEVLNAWRQAEAEGFKPVPALYQAMDQVLASQAEKLAIPRRFCSPMKELWALQQRFAHRSGKRPFRLPEHPRFRAGLDFLLLRCESGEVEPELGQWWADFYAADEVARLQMVTPEPRPRRRPRSRKGAGSREAPAAEPTSGRLAGE